MGFQPQLWVERAGAAVEFYGAAFGAVVLHQVGEGDDIVAQLEVDGAAFWVAAADPEMGRHSPRTIHGATGRTLLVTPEPDAVVDRAVGAGATETSPVVAEYGWRLGRIVDPFGHEWEIGTPVGRGRRVDRRSGLTPDRRGPAARGRLPWHASRVGGVTPSGFGRPGPC